jgi:hypothetical protein
LRRLRLLLLLLLLLTLLHLLHDLLRCTRLSAGAEAGPYRRLNRLFWLLLDHLVVVAGIGIAVGLLAALYLRLRLILAA